MQSPSALRIDSADLARLKDRMPDLSALDLPRLEVVGRTADETIDRVLGRSRAPIWPWIATGIGLMAIAGAIGTYLWMRRPMGNSARREPVVRHEPVANVPTVDEQPSVRSDAMNGAYGEPGSTTTSDTTMPVV